MSDTLSLQARITAAPADVFHALTDEAAMTTWLAEHATIALTDDRRYEFWGRSTPQGDRARQALQSVDPNRMLRFSWTLDGTPTTVEIDLQANDDQTVLHLRHDGLPTFEQLVAPSGRRDGLHSMHTFWGLALANLAEYTEGRPLTPRADFRPERAPEIRVRMEIDAAPHEVFTSLTDPSQASRWFGWEIEIEPRLGGSVTFGAAGKIFKFQPDKSLAYSDDEGTITRWELEGAGDKTFLTFVQSGYTDDEWDTAAQHEAGWLGSLAELKRLHEFGHNWAPLISELPTGDEPESNTT